MAKQPSGRNPAFRHAPVAAAAFITLSASGSLFAQQDTGDTVLPTIVVKDKVEEGDRERNGYQGGTTRIGKLKQLPKDIPQSVTVVSEQLMYDRNTTTLKDALQYVSGITFNSAEGGRIGDNMNLRGFYSFGDMYLDGIRDVAQVRRETFNLEQIDVLKGSAGMLFGRGSGGAINQVSKEARLTDRMAFQAGIDNWGLMRTTADLNKALNDDSAFRINALLADGGTFRDSVNNYREGFAPTVRFGIGGQDEVSISYYYLKTYNTGDFGLPFFQQRPLDVPSSRFYGTTMDFEESISNVLTASWTHRFSPDTELRNVTRVGSYGRALWANQPGIGNATTILPTTVVTRSTHHRGGQDDNVTNQTDLVSKFELAGMKHEAVVGMELLHEKGAQFSFFPNGNGGLANPTTVGNPTVGAGAIVSPIYGNTVARQTNSYSGNTIAIYAQDTIEFIPKWKILAGIRQDNLNGRYVTNNATTGIAYVDFREQSYRSGLMYQPTDDSTYYVSYSDTFSPTADLYQFSAAGNIIPPERSKNAEIGAKWDLFEGNLSLRAAYYRAVKLWERNTDAESAPTSSLLSKRRHTNGIELEAAGRLSSQWEVFTGLALMGSYIDETVPVIANPSGGAALSTGTNPLLTGERARNTPSYTYNLWSTYKLNDQWKVGGGVTAVGARRGYGVGTAANNTAPVVNIAPAYDRWDAMVAYKVKNYELKANLLNIFNERYYDAIYENGAMVSPGASRTLQLSAEVKF